MSGALVMLGLYLFVAAVLVALGVGPVRGRVPPNHMYGFRTRRTLADPRAWYAANRAAGLGSILTGFATAVAAVATYAAGLTLPAAPLVNLGVLLSGVAATVTLGQIAACRAQGPDAP